MNDNNEKIEEKKRVTVEGEGIIRAATILAFGNVASRLLGLVRETVKANLFGASGLLSAFTVAAYVPTSLFDLIIGGMVNSSLVPVFSDYVDQDGASEELWGVVSRFLTVATIILILAVIVVELLAPQIAWGLGANNFTDPALTELSISLMRLATPVVFFLSISSILTGVLYALKRFALPAFTGAFFNGSIVLVALLRPTEISSLVWGLLLGSVMQILLQLPALPVRKLKWQFDWQHPVIRRVLRLYAPVVAGLVVNQIAIGVSYNLATRTGDESVNYMGYATTLYQFPLGLVVTALSIATLPTLAQQTNRLDDFKQTLASGIRFVLLLILPATAGLFALSTPIVQLLFEHGAFTQIDTEKTALVLRFYLLGLPFAGVDQMLVFASYARKDTWHPALVGVISIVIYLATAVLLLPHLQLLSLMVADAVKHVVHTIMMLWLLQRQLDGLRGYRVSRMAVQAGGVAFCTGGVAYGLWFLLQQWDATGFLIDLVRVVIPGMGGILIYIAGTKMLRIPEVDTVLQIVGSRFRFKKSG